MKLFPQKNIGAGDRVTRLILGVLVGFYAFYGNYGTIFMIILLAVSVFCFYQAIVGWCAFYQIIGKNTCPVTTD